MTIIKKNNRFFVRSWTDGDVVAKQPTRPLRECDVLARALYLERNGKIDEAELLLESYCA